MNYLLIAVLIILVVLLTTNREGFQEAFGLSGYTKHVDSVKLDDPRPDLSKYNEIESDIDNDMMQDFVLLANKEITKRTGICNYIIETTSVKTFRGEDNDIYECMFMTVKNNGFAFGFSVVASFEVKNKNVRIVSLRTQPLGVQVVGDLTPYVEGSSGKEFINYRLVKEMSVPNRSEFESAKIKLQ
jgi:hypothetical protein